MCVSLQDPAKERYTIFINTFKRPDRLSRAVAHYSRCGPLLAEIRVVWSEPDPPDPAVVSRYLAREPPVYIDTHETTSLNNR